MIKLVFILAVFVVTLGVASCGSETKVTRVEPGVVTDISGRWNDSDSRMVAEAMITEMHARPWLQKFTETHERKPVVVVGTIVNESHEHLNVRIFITDLERALTNAENVIFVAEKGSRDEIREERQDQAIHSREDTQKRPGQEVGADFILTGYISTLLDETGGTKVVLYQVDLKLTDLESNIKSWYGQKKIKKVIERKRLLF